MYIETGIYLIDFGVKSYATGATLRLFLLLELQMLVFYFFSKKYQREIDGISAPKAILRYEKTWNMLSFFIIGYILLDVIISGNVLTNRSVNRFNFYSKYSMLPFAQVFSYFIYPLSFVQGYEFLNGGLKKQKAYSVVFIAITLVALFLRGIQFGGFAIVLIHFAMPIVMPLAHKHKLLKLRYIMLAASLLVVMLIPKYNYFTKTTMYNNMGFKSAYEILVYRALGQGADLTWKLDQQIVEKGSIDPQQAINEIASVLSGKIEGNGADYLMRRACPRNVYARYKTGTASITGGYPIIWAALFGYIGAMIPVALDAVMFWFLLYKILRMLKKKKITRLFMYVFLYNQCYSIIMGSGLHYFGNMVPRVFLICLLVLDVFAKDKDIRFTFGKKVL